jgi:hypothetical protein
MGHYGRYGTMSSLWLGYGFLGHQTVSITRTA